MVASILGLAGERTEAEQKTDLRTRATEAGDPGSLFSPGISVTGGTATQADARPSALDAVVDGRDHRRDGFDP